MALLGRSYVNRRLIGRRIVAVAAAGGALTASATLAATGTITAGGVVGKSATATIAETGTIAAASQGPFVTAVSSDSRYLVDQHGTGIVPQFDTMWSIIQQAGNTSLNGGSATWQQDIDFWLTTRSGQGFNAVKVSLFGQTDNGAPNSDSRTFDTKYPFGGTAGGTAYASPSAGLASDYWTRVDYLIDQAAAAGVTVFIDIITPQDVTTGIGGVMCSGVGGSVKSLAEFQALGTALGGRYASKANIVWFIGADYFDEEVTKIQGLLTSLANAGDNHLVTVENWASPGGHTWTTSRKTDASVSMTLGSAVADFDSSYIYDQTYLSASLARATSPTLPVIWIDGYYEQAGDDSLALRRFTAWSLTYGQPGLQYGNEATWSTQSGWRTVTSSPSSELGHIIKIRQAFTGYARWPDLVPDTGSSFIAAGRSSGDSFVTGGKTADGQLAIIYLPNAASSITVDTTQMTAGYTVTWVDPTNAATVSGSTGTSFSRGTANAGGGADWLLVLQAPSSPTGTATLTGTDTITTAGTVGKQTGATAAETATVAATGVVGRSTTASLAATDTVTAAGSVGEASGSTLAATDALTATGSVGESATASIAAAGTITAAGTVTAAGTAGATLAETATVTTAGQVGTSATGSIAATDTLAAAGLTGKQTTASVAATGMLTAAGAVTAGTAAALAETVTITAAGQVARSTTAALAATGTISAAGSVTGDHVRADAERESTVPAENRIGVVAAESRFPVVPAETRITHA